MSNFPQVAPIFICPLCNKPVDLKTSPIDAQGQAVHEDCYVAEIQGTAPRKS